MKLSPKYKNRLFTGALIGMFSFPFVRVDIATEQAHARRVRERESREGLVDVSKWNDGTQSVVYGGLIAYREVYDKNSDGIADYARVVFCALRRGGYVSHLEKPNKQDQEMLDFGLPRYKSGRRLGIVQGITRLFN